MLEPDYFYGKSDVLISYEQELEDWILQDIAMRLLKAGSMAGTTDMELYKLQQLGMHQNEIVKRLSILTKKSRNEIRRLLQDAVMTSWKDDKETLNMLGIKTIAPLENPLVIALMDAEFKKTLGEVNNLTRSTMMQSQRDLMNMLNEAEMRVTAGVQSYSAAVCDILDRYGKTGVMIDYPTGTRRTLEAAVRMCVVTSMNQTAAQVTNHYISQHKVEYVLVSAHLGARTQREGQPYLAGHDNWQGKCYKISGSDPDTPNLAEMTGYDIENGTGRVINPLGLHGYNCRHSHKPWNKSLRNPYLDENGNLKIDSDENRKVYDLQQQQRAMERAIRQTKRQLLVKQAEVDGVAETDVKSMLQPEYDRLAYRLWIQNQKYKQFCADNGLQTQADRIKVAGFKRAQSAKANGRATVYKNEKYESYEADLGKNMVSKSEFTKIMSDRSEKKLFTHYSDAVKRGDVSPLADYYMYRRTAMELQDKCVGLVTSNGVKLEKRSLHCIDRVIGSVEQRRSGITVDDVVKTLTSPEAEIRPVRYSKTAASQKFIYKNAEVTINPDTKTLIQVNPHHRER